MSKKKKLNLADFHVHSRGSADGVYNIEEFDPDPFMDALNKWGLPWKETFTPDLVD